jgi:cell wall-associated NlpC family hydrolase
MNHRPGRLARVIGVALITSVIIPATLAHATPIDDKKAQAKRLQDQIDANYNQLEVLSEQENGAQYKLQQANQAIAAAQVRVDSAKAETTRLHSVLNGRATALYKTAGGGGGNSTAGNALDITAQATRAKYAAAAASKDSSTIDLLKRAREELAVQQQNFEANKAAAQQQSNQISQSKLSLERLNSRQQSLLKQTQGELANLIAQELARRKVEEARQAAAEQARRRSAAIAARGATSSGGGGGRSAVTVDYTHVPAPNARAGAAVAFAQAQLGKPYQYGAAGPGSFDCSGLTMSSWAAAGVSMPHYSGAQAAMFPRVPDDQIQPGDLVLYYGDLHHVAIAVNGSQAINAPHTGDFVKVEPIFRGGYRFAVRPG